MNDVGPADAAQVLPVGTLVGDFEIVGLIGVGGFGIVYEAEDPVLQRRVALKEYMPASMAARIGPLQVAMLSESARETFETGRRSFINEARLLAQFDHPSLVKVYRFWEANGTAYMVMPLYRGPTLRRAIVEERIPVSEPWLLGLLAPLLEALEHLHRARCYHRDIAPDNILLIEDGLPLLLDFGAARRVIGDATQDMTVILKPGFAPIEQYGGGSESKQGPWTDLHALACVVYFCATGRVPMASVSRILSDTLPPLAVASGGMLSARFCAAIDHAMRVRIEERTDSVATFRRELGLAESAPSTLFVPDIRPSGEAELTGQAAAANGRAAMGATELLGMAPFRDDEQGLGGRAPSRETAPQGAASQQQRPGPSGRPSSSQPSASSTGHPGRQAGAASWLPWIVIGSILIAIAGGVGWVLHQTRTPSPPIDQVVDDGRTATPDPVSEGTARLPAGHAGEPTMKPAVPEPAMPRVSEFAPRPERSPAAIESGEPPVASIPADAGPFSAPPGGFEVPLPAVPYSARAVIDSVGELADPRINVQVTLERRRLRINRDPLRFKVRSSEAGYLYLLMAGTRDNDLYLLFPNEQEGDNRLAANTERTLPGRGWEMVFEGPAGIDHFVAIVSPNQRIFPEPGLQPIGLFREYAPDAAAALFRARRGSAFIGEPLDCGAGDAGCQRFGAARFEIEEVD